MKIITKIDDTIFRIFVMLALLVILGYTAEETLFPYSYEIVTVLFLVGMVVKEIMARTERRKSENNDSSVPDNPEPPREKPDKHSDYTKRPFRKITDYPLPEEQKSSSEKPNIKSRKQQLKEKRARKENTQSKS